MTFNLSKTQMSKLKKWQEAIFTIYHEYGNYRFIFQPTGIGEIVTVECDLVPNNVLDLTEVENW